MWGRPWRGRGAVCCARPSPLLRESARHRLSTVRPSVSTPRFRPLLPSVRRPSRLRDRETSYMETLLLFVQQLEAQGLNAADDSPLVADQLHPETPHISRPRAGAQTHTNTHTREISGRVILYICHCLLQGNTHFHRWGICCWKTARLRLFCPHLKYISIFIHTTHFHYP